MFFSTEHIDANTVMMAVLSVATFVNALLRHRAEWAANRKASHLQDTADKIHTLSNSRMGAQLQINTVAFKALVVASQRLALMTGQEADKAALAAAQAGLMEAERGLMEHLIQQARVDAADVVMNVGKS